MALKEAEEIRWTVRNGADLRAPDAVLPADSRWGRREKAEHVFHQTQRGRRQLQFLGSLAGKLTELWGPVNAPLLLLHIPAQGPLGVLMPELRVQCQQPSKNHGEGGISHCMWRALPLTLSALKPGILTETDWRATGILHLMPSTPPE